MMREFASLLLLVLLILLARKLVWCVRWLWRYYHGRETPEPIPFLPRRVLPPRQALFAESRVERLARCEGAVAACQIAPYPPGVPVVAPGEEIGKKELAYLEKIGYNMMTEVRILSQ